MEAPNDEANRRCRAQSRSAENGNRKDRRRTLTFAAASELSDWLGVTACSGNRLFAWSGATRVAVRRETAWKLTLPR